MGCQFNRVKLIIPECTALLQYRQNYVSASESIDPPVQQCSSNVFYFQLEVLKHF